MFKFQFIQNEKGISSDQFLQFFFRPKKSFVCSTILPIADLNARCLSFNSFKLKNGIVQTSLVSDLKNKLLFVLLFYT